MRGRTAVATVLALALAAGGCASMREKPSTSPADLEAVDEQREAAEEPVPEQDARLALARTAEELGYPELADEILTEAGERAVASGEYSMQAMSLFLRGFMALQAGSHDQAAILIEDARLADPSGPLADPASLSIALLEELSRKELELAELRERLAATEQQVGVGEERSGALEAELEAVKEQLDELKQIHLRVESEKQDDPP
jgi:hypothetical protein